MRVGVLVKCPTAGGGLAADALSPGLRKCGGGFGLPSSEGCSRSPVSATIVCAHAAAGKRRSAAPAARPAKPRFRPVVRVTWEVVKEHRRQGAAPAFARLPDRPHDGRRGAASDAQMVTGLRT